MEIQQSKGGENQKASPALDDEQSYFEPITSPKAKRSNRTASNDWPMDRIALQRIASASQVGPNTTPTTPGTLEKMVSIARVATDHPALDPSSADFDITQWLRWYLSKEEQTDVVYGPRGVTFKNLSISGLGPERKYLETVLSLLTKPFRWNMGKKTEKKIIRDANGTIKSGKMLLVLGRPGSGCSTFLRGISGELEGLKLDKESTVHYSGK